MTTTKFGHWLYQSSLAEIKTWSVPVSFSLLVSVSFWLLATSLPVASTLAKKVVKLYRTRMQIEEGFRAVKSHRFGLSLNYHRTGSMARLQMLLLIATLALMVLWLMGMAMILLKQHYRLKGS